MQQLIFDLYPDAPPTLNNFVVGRNEEAFVAVRAFIEAIPNNAPAPTGLFHTSLYLWGADGAGKSHLLHAARAHAQTRGVSAHLLVKDNAFPPLPELAMPPALWLIDGVDHVDDDWQGYLFTLYNALRENGGGLLVAASVPPTQLTLREDLRTRLGWGGIYEITTLRDEDKLQALIAHADARGLRLPAEIVAYLLKHSRRDMRSLVTVLDALDRYSLSLKRPLTLPLVREWLLRQETENKLA